MRQVDAVEAGVPPNRNGVGPSCVTTPPGPWLTVTEFLVQRFPGVTRDAWLARLARGDVIDALDEELGPHFFPEREGAGDPRVCPSCSGGRRRVRRRPGNG